MPETIFDSVTARIDRLDWDELQRQLDNRGVAVTAPVLSKEECVELAGLFDSDRFRSTIDMARHRFGDGRYRYFAHLLPGGDPGRSRCLLRAPGASREPLGRPAVG